MSASCAAAAASLATGYAAAAGRVYGPRMTGHDDHRHAPGEQDWDELGAHLELEGEVLLPYLHEAISTLLAMASAGQRAVRRIVDLGSGPGVATTALADAFPDARVVALDRAPALLRQARERADRLGVGDRVTTVTGDLEAGLGAVEPVDLAWAGMVLHHLADPATLLRQLRGILQPGGLVAIAEFGPATRTLAHDLGFGLPGFAARHAEALAVAIEAHLPAGAMHLNWPAMLHAAGFDLIDQRTLLVDLQAPLAEPARRLVSQELRRSVAMVQERLSVDDQATLAVLTDPVDARSVFQRADVELHIGRSLYVARRR